MPIRFQVEPDFYDHPKCIGLSDAAVALWTRAGSYAAAKLTDGFVPDAKLAELSQAPQEAAAELVSRGLWKRKKGGYAFHEWSPRNITRQEVEERRERDRRRKRRGTAPEQVGKSASKQVKGQKFQAESERNPNGVQPESSGPPLGRINTTQHNSVVLLEGSYEPSKPRNERGPKRATRLPEDFTVTEAMQQWVRENTPHVDGWAETEKFKDYWRGKSGKDATKVDWVATWRNWMRNAQDRGGSNGRSSPNSRPPGPKVDPQNAWKADLS